MPATLTPVAVARLETLVADPRRGGPRHRTDYAGTAWSGQPPQIGGADVVSSVGAGQISAPFWLPDSHTYEAGAAGNAQIQASASLQSVSGDAQVLQVGAGLGEDPRGGGGLLVYVRIIASTTGSLGVAYRVSVVCAPEMLRLAAG